jgi:polar amino acid transport system permease protein
MDVIAAVMPALLKGAKVTLLVGSVSGLLALVISVVVGVLRRLENRLIRMVTGTYVEFFRGTSAFVQVYWAYFALPMLGVRLSALEAGITVLALNVGAYGSEVVRGALAAVPRGQLEACAALGLPRWLAYLKVLLPQAMARAILPMSNLLVDLLKGTSLLSAITIMELAFAGRQSVATFGHPLPIFGVVLFFYLCMTGPIAYVGRLLHRRGGWKQTSGPAA